MAEEGLFQLILSQTGTGGIAVLALWLLNKAYADALRREREYAENLRSVYNAQTQSTKELTQALTELRHAIEDTVRGSHRREA